MDLWVLAMDLTDLKIINPQNGGINSSAELSFLARLVAAVPYSYTRLDACDVKCVSRQASVLLNVHSILPVDALNRFWWNSPTQNFEIPHVWLNNLKKWDVPQAFEPSLPIFWIFCPFLSLFSAAKTPRSFRLQDASLAHFVVPFPGDSWEKREEDPITWVFLCVWGAEEVLLLLLLLLLLDA